MNRLKVSEELVLVAQDIVAGCEKKASMRDVYKKFPRNSYLFKFFQEKDISEKDFKKIDKNGVTHFIPNEVVVEHIALAQGSEKKKIEDMLRKIDFANGDVNRFLEHLAGAIADNYGEAF